MRTLMCGLRKRTYVYDTVVVSLYRTAVLFPHTWPLSSHYMVVCIIMIHVNDLHICSHKNHIKHTQVDHQVAGPSTTLAGFGGALVRLNAELVGVIVLINAHN